MLWCAFLLKIIDLNLDFMQPAVDLKTSWLDSANMTSLLWFVVITPSVVSTEVKLQKGEGSRWSAMPTCPLTDILSFSSPMEPTMDILVLAKLKLTLLPSILVRPIRIPFEDTNYERGHSHLFNKTINKLIFKHLLTIVKPICVYNRQNVEEKGNHIANQLHNFNVTRLKTCGLCVSMFQAWSSWMWFFQLQSKNGEMPTEQTQKWFSLSKLDSPCRLVLLYFRVLS